MIVVVVDDDDVDVDDVDVDDAIVDVGGIFVAVIVAGSCKNSFNRKASPPLR